MKALVLEAPGVMPKMALREVPEPELAPHDALLRVLACGFCHHDRLAMIGVLRRGVRPNAILGHEICGEVARIGIFTPHECVPQPTTAPRQFLRIVGRGVAGREDYFTINPLVPA